MQLALLLYWDVVDRGCRVSFPLSAHFVLSCCEMRKRGKDWRRFFFFSDSITKEYLGHTAKQKKQHQESFYFIETEVNFMSLGEHCWGFCHVSIVEVAQTMKRFKTSSSSSSSVWSVSRRCAKSVPTTEQHSNNIWNDISRSIQYGIWHVSLDGSKGCFKLFSSYCNWSLTLLYFFLFSVPQKMCDY